MCIRDRAIHQQRDVNRGHDYNAQKDMQPLYALGGGPSLTALLAEELGVDAGDVYKRQIMLIVGCATAMAWALTQSGFSGDLARLMAGMPGGSYGFLAVSIVAFIILGSCLLYTSRCV